MKTEYTIKEILMFLSALGHHSDRQELAYHEKRGFFKSIRGGKGRVKIERGEASIIVQAAILCRSMNAEMSYSLVREYRLKDNSEGDTDTWACILFGKFGPVVQWHRAIQPTDVEGYYSSIIVDFVKLTLDVHGLFLKMDEA